MKTIRHIFLSIVITLAVLFGILVSCSKYTTNNVKHEPTDTHKAPKESAPNKLQKSSSVVFIIVGKSARIYKSRKNGYVLRLNRVNPEVMWTAKNRNWVMGKVTLKQLFKTKKPQSATVLIKNTILKAKIIQARPYRSYYLFTLKIANGKQIPKLRTYQPVSIIVERNI